MKLQNGLLLQLGSLMKISFSLKEYCLVYASLFTCTPVGGASDSMMTPT